MARFHTMRVTDPRDPDNLVIDVDYEVIRDRPDPSVGWNGYTVFQLDRSLFGEFSADERRSILDEVEYRHE